MSKRQTVFFLPVDPMDKEHKDPEKIDLGAPRLARYMHKAWNKHQNTVNWVNIKLAQKKGLKFYQTRSNATFFTKHSQQIVVMESGEIKNEKEDASPRLPPKISLRHDWMKELGTEVARQAEVNQPTQPNPNPNHDRTERPVVIGQPTGSSTPFDEVDIDFRVSGLPHAVVKQAENSRVRELVKEIDYARQFVKCNAKNAFFTGIKASSAALAGLSWERINPAEVSSDGHWIFSQSRTMSLRRSDLMAIVMGRLKNKRSASSLVI